MKVSLLFLNFARESYPTFGSNAHSVTLMTVVNLIRWILKRIRQEDVYGCEFVTVVYFRG